MPYLVTYQLEVLAEYAAEWQARNYIRAKMKKFGRKRYKLWKKVYVPYATGDKQLYGRIWTMTNGDEHITEGSLFMLCRTAKPYGQPFRDGRRFELWRRIEL